MSARRAIATRWPRAIALRASLLGAARVRRSSARSPTWCCGRSPRRWYFPNKLPQEFGFTFWGRVFAPRGNAMASLGTSVWIALLTVVVCLAVAMPAGYALARLKLPLARR